MATGGVSWSTVARELHEVDEDYQPELDTALDFFHPDDRPRLRAAIDAAMTRGEPYDLEIRFISARGKHLWTQTCCSPVTEGGRVVKLLGTFQDITKRKQLEEQLREALLRQQEAVKAANVGLWDWDLTTGEVRFSAEWKRQIGYEDHEIGTGFDEWQSRVHPDDLPAVLEQVQRAIDEGRSSVQTEFRFRHKDGSYRWILAQSSVLHDEHGKAVRMLGSHVDVTASRHAEEAQASLQEQFRQSQKMESIGRLAGGIAHDFNNLLTIINSYATFAVEDLRPEDPLCADLGQIIDAGERASALTRQLLAFSRRQIMAPEILDLNEVVGDLEKMLVRLIGEDIVLRVTPGADLGLVHTDRAQLEQVIMNLVVNARDAMPDGGKLTIETANVTLDESYVADHPGSRAGPHVMLAVTDTGVGMTAEVKARVFEPFFTTKEQGKGTGLGLAMAYGVVNQSEGTISVYAEPGTGTTFKVYLPLAEGVDKPTRAPAADPMDLHGTETVLVVEDEEGVRTMAARILRSAGYKVILAENAGEALLECERKPDEVQLLLTDVVMPKMSGKELAERLANVVPGLKVLYMSGYTENTIVHHGVLEEGTNFIAKPFNAPALLRSVRITLDAH